MPSYKMRKMNYGGSALPDEYLAPRKLKCELCGVVMVDGEPGLAGGEFDHPANGCRNGGRRGRTYDYTCSGKRRVYPGINMHNLTLRPRPRVPGLVPVQPKRHARAKRRGARAAAKRRPR